MYDNFRDLMKSNKLVCSDMNILTDAFTYCNSDESCVSWIDHILCTNLLNSVINDLQLLYDYMLSDHNSLLVRFSDLFPCDSHCSVSGDQNITEMWRNHLQLLYNSVECNEDNKLVGKRLLTANDDKVTVCLADVLDAINKQKKGKSPGPDGLQSEAYMYGGLRLATHLCILFNLFFRFIVLCQTVFVSCTIVPLVKCKARDLTGINNYRAITLSNAITKIVELVLLLYGFCA